MRKGNHWRMLSTVIKVICNFCLQLWRYWSRSALTPSFGESSIRDFSNEKSTATPTMMLPIKWNSTYFLEVISTWTWGISMNQEFVAIATATCYYKVGRAELWDYRYFMQMQGVLLTKINSKTANGNSKQQIWNYSPDRNTSQQLRKGCWNFRQRISCLWKRPPAGRLFWQWSSNHHEMLP